MEYEIAEKFPRISVTALIFIFPSSNYRGLQKVKSKKDEHRKHMEFIILVAWLFLAFMVYFLFGFGLIFLSALLHCFSIGFVTL